MAVSSRPYQSRLLKFLLRQSQQVKDRCGRSVRQIKLGAYWGAQVVLYPVYAVFQTTRLASRQLQADHQAPQQQRGLLWACKRWISRRQTRDLPAPDLSTSDLSTLETTAAAAPLTSDRAILQILSLFKPARLHPTHFLTPSRPPVTPVTPAGLTLRPPSPPTLRALPSIHGIACQLADRTIVLVGDHNNIWSGLTPDQQETLRQQMSWVLADYFYRRRQADQRLRSRLGILPPPATLDRALPPINRLRQLMGWMQTGPVAIAANLFKEAELFEVLQSRLAQASIAHAHVRQQISTALITTDHPIPPSLAGEAHPLRSVVLPRLIDYQTRLAAIATQWLQASRLAQRLPPLKLPPAFQRMMPKLLPPSRSQPDPTGDHQPSPQVFLPKNPRPLIAPPLPWARLDSPTDNPGDTMLLRERNPGDAQIQSEQMTAPHLTTHRLGVNPTAATATLPKTTSQPPELSLSQGDNSVPLSPESPCLETKATVVEYIEHPLEKILRWLDQLLSKLEVWIEQGFAQLKRWVNPKE